MTVAAFSSDSTWSIVTSASVLTLAVPTTVRRPSGASQADRPALFGPGLMSVYAAR